VVEQQFPGAAFEPFDARGGNIKFSAQLVLI
jgi:hypothetical protein